MLFDEYMMLDMILHDMMSSQDYVKQCKLLPSPHKMSHSKISLSAFEHKDKYIQGEYDGVERFQIQSRTVELSSVPPLDKRSIETQKNSDTTLILSF